MARFLVEIQVTHDSQTQPMDVIVANDVKEAAIEADLRYARITYWRHVRPIDGRDLKLQERGFRICAGEAGCPHGKGIRHHVCKMA